MVHPHKSYIKQLRDLDWEINKIHSTPEDFLAITFKKGSLRIACESWTLEDSTNFIESQLKEMSTEDRSRYASNKLRVNSLSTYYSNSRSSRIIIPHIVEEDSGRQVVVSVVWVKIIEPEVDLKPLDEL